MSNVELGFVYALQNPITGEFFYVGATRHSLKSRLNDHYGHLSECRKDRRKNNKKFNYLENLLPTKCKIILLEIVVKDSLFNAEKKWIKHFRKINPNLTNMTDGGIGGETWKYYSDSEKEKSGKLISKKTKGVPNSPEHNENISKSRIGYLHHNKVRLEDPIVALDKEKKLVKVFNYIFEINQFLNNKHSGSNVKRILNDDRLHYKYYWITFSQLKSETQDIVDAKVKALE